MTVRAMAIAGDKLVSAGVPDIGRRNQDILFFENEDEALMHLPVKKEVSCKLSQLPMAAQRLKLNCRQCRGLTVWSLQTVRYL